MPSHRLIPAFLLLLGGVSAQHDLRRLEARITDTVALVSPSVVFVGSGTGVIISADGWIATAGHVTALPDRRMTVRLHDGRTVYARSRGLAIDQDAGLAKMEDEGPWPFIPFAAGDAPTVGDWCLAIGHPEGLRDNRKLVVRLGRVFLRDGPLVGADVTCTGGDSGGPLFDLDGRVIGILSGPLHANRSPTGPGLFGVGYTAPSWFRTHRERLEKNTAWNDGADRRARDVLREFTKGAPDLLARGRSIVANARRSVVRVLCDGKDVALGTIVGPAGWVLTHAGSLKGKVEVALGESVHSATVTGVAAADDLALLKIEAAGLQAITFSEGVSPPQGRCVLSVGCGESPLMLGVVSVPVRDQRKDRQITTRARLPFDPLPKWTRGPEGFKMVGLDVSNIARPEATDLKEGDRILAVADRETPDFMAFSAMTEQYVPGSKVPITVRRGDEIVKGHAKTHASELELTCRYPRVLQHDAHVPSGFLGGPIVDLEGSCVGVNVASDGRAMKYESYAVTPDRLRALLFDLASGKLAPRGEGK